MPSSPELTITQPSIADGAEMWRIARDSKELDLNASYSYLLMARDFWSTSVIAKVSGKPAGFVTGFLRPSAPNTLVVWQVAVDQDHRGKGIARQMLQALVDRCSRQGVWFLETTITPDNNASIGLFTSLAEQVRAPIVRTDLFASDHFPDEHKPEQLYRIGPWSTYEGRS
ncbi:diaminobutyrate acetyltransferase [Pseudonocardiaceae bacterium YIM PH 21723]|nr:diaminobutyrate acetyltransferase [Pseudonocardiaceae bacterium YIM PH 21723]